MPLKTHSSFLLILSLFPFIAFGKATSEKSSISKNSNTSLKFCIGYLHPLFEFAEVPKNDYYIFRMPPAYIEMNLAGKATGGINTALEFSYQVIKHFELGLYVDYSNINISPATYSELFPNDTSTMTFIWSNSDNWETIAPMLTAAFCVSHQKWKGSVQVMAGWQLAWSPEVILNSEIPETGTFNGIDRYHITLSQPSRHQNAFCYGASANISYMLNEKFGLFLNGKYQYSDHEFNEGGTVDYTSKIAVPQGTINTVVVSRDFTFSKTIEFFTINLGASYAF